MNKLNSARIDADAVEHQSKLLYDNALILSKLEDLDPEVKIKFQLEYPDGSKFSFLVKDKMRDKFIDGFSILLSKRIKELIRSIGALNL